MQKGIGQKMLEKMGWKEGEGLGTNKDGIKDPVLSKPKKNKKGLGYNKEQTTEIEHEYNSLLKKLKNKNRS